MRPLKRDGVVNMYPSDAFLSVPHKASGLKRVMCMQCVLEKHPKLNNPGVLGLHMVDMLGMSEEVFRTLTKKVAASLENFQNKYGAVEGARRYAEYREKLSTTRTLDGALARGETQEVWAERNRRRAVTLENQIKKYGVEEGTIRFNSYVEKLKYSNSLAAYIEKYGEKEGRKRWGVTSRKKAITVENYVSRGVPEKEAVEIVLSIKKKILNRRGGSRIANELFAQVLALYGGVGVYTDLTDKGEYGTLLSDGSYMYIDYYDPDKGVAIEFHGDHYHGNPSMYQPQDLLKGHGLKNVSAADRWQRDEARLRGFQDKTGVVPYVVWEHDYRTDPEGVLNKIGELYAGNN